VTELDEAIAELEQAAARLRSEEIDPEEVAELAERCARLAAEVGAALERQAAASAEAPGEERLL